MSPGEFHGLRVADLDAVDREIVRQLQEDGRRSVATIAKCVGLSHAGTRQRVQRLLESRVVHVGAVSSPATHGFARQAFVAVHSDHRVRDVAAALEAFDETYYVVICNGAFDVVVEALCRDDQSLLDFVCRIRELPGVLGTDVLEFLALTKWRYAPGFLDERPADDAAGRSPAHR